MDSEAIPAHCRRKARLFKSKVLIVSFQKVLEKILQDVKERGLVYVHEYSEDLGKQHNGNDDPYSEQEAVHDGVKEASLTTLTPGQVLQGTGFRPRNSYNGIEIDITNATYQTIPKISLTTPDVTRWKMAWRAHQIFEGRDHLTFSQRGLVRRCKDLPDTVDILYELPILFGFSAAALTYGGLHALAWFAHFDSSTEQLLWRNSACVVMSGIPVISVLCRFAVLLQERSHLTRPGESSSIGSIDLLLFGLSVFVLFPAYVLLPAYVLARGYLVVECFINLSHLPAEVYNVPTWSAYFPHIS